jgi:hypothetical protein
VQLQPASSDATQGAAWQEQLARIEAQTGDIEDAIADLQHLLQTPYRSAFYGTAITPSLLRQDPTWDPVRKDPRYLLLLKEAPVKSAGMGRHG